MKTLFKLLFASIFVVQAHAQTVLRTNAPSKALSVATSPEAVGISSERLKRIDNALNDLVKQDKLPGMVALVARNGQIVYQKSFGLADIASKRPMKNDDIFRIASMTKAITSTAVMMLYEEGKFSLDDPISKFIPEFKNPQVLDTYNPADTTYTTKPAKGEITIRQLLNHTSGIGYGAIDSDDRFKAIFQKVGIIDAFTTKPIKIADNIKKLAKIPLHFNPGEKWSYGEGLDVLGYFVEIVSGVSFDTYLRTHLFEPLGMNDTYFYLPDSKKDRLVSLYIPDSTQKWKTLQGQGLVADPDYPIKGAKTFFSGGGGLSSTAKDYATFLQMLLNGGAMNGKRYLSRTTVDIMANANQVGDLFGGPKADAYFSLAFMVLNENGHAKGQGSVGRFSWGGAFNTNYWVDPKEKIIMVLMKQTLYVPNDDSQGIFTRLIYQSIDD